MSALAALTRTQAKAFAREPLSVFFGLVFPALLLVVIGIVFPVPPSRTPTSGEAASSRSTRRSASLSDSPRSP